VQNLICLREGTRVPEHPIYMEQATHYRESISASHPTLMRLGQRLSTAESGAALSIDRACPSKSSQPHKLEEIDFLGRSNRKDTKRATCLEARAAKGRK
jgi:hypothetical protein